MPVDADAGEVRLTTQPEETISVNVTYDTVPLSEIVTQAFPEITGLFVPSQVPYDPYTIGFPSIHESFRMSSFASANSMIRLEEDRTSSSAGEKVMVYLLPE